MKRENFRAAFSNFDFDKVAEFGEDDVARLLGDAGMEFAKLIRELATIL